MLEHEEIDVPLADGALRVLRWGRGPHAAVALHGITGSAACWQAVARALPADWSLFAVDMRGRGHSADLPGPYSVARHEADVAAAVDALVLDRPVLVGHSSGAYVALLIMGSRPERFGGLLLIDGGLPLPVPEGVDLDAVTDATLGPAITRLRETYPSVDAYFDFWRAHPAFKDAWNSDIEDYLRYDLTGPDGALRSRVCESAVRADSRELLGASAQLAAALQALPRPTRVLTAPAGMFGQPPGLQPAELCQAWTAQAPMLITETVPGSNHYTIILDPVHAAVVAARITQTATPE